MTDRQTFQEVSGRLGVSVSTLKAWTGRLSLGNERGANGKRFLSLEEIAVLEAAKMLRDEGSGLNTITRKLTPDSHLVDADEQVTASRLSDDSHLTTKTTFDIEAVAVRLVEAMKNENDLAEKYARAAHRIGELEATLKAVEADRERITSERDKALQLAAPQVKPWWKIWQ